MRKNLFRMAILMCLAAIGIFAVRLQAAKAGKLSDLPVTSTIADTDSLGAAFQIQNDDLGSYSNTKAVQSVIQSVGDWVLDTNHSSLSTRGVYLDFSRPIGGASAPFVHAGVKARLITQCPTYGYSMLLLGNEQSVNCGLVIGFEYGGNSYRLAMNPGGVNHYSDTDTVKVSCIGAGTNGQCNQWSISNINGDLGSAAKLLVQTTAKGKVVWQDLGNFYFSFSINVKNP